MNRLTVEALRAAWWRPVKYEDPFVDFEVRLEAVQDAVLQAQEQLPLTSAGPIPIDLRGETIEIPSSCTDELKAVLRRLNNVAWKATDG